MFWCLPTLHFPLSIIISRGSVCVCYVAGTFVVITIHATWSSLYYPVDCWAISIGQAQRAIFSWVDIIDTYILCHHFDYVLIARVAFSLRSCWTMKCHVRHLSYISRREVMIKVILTKQTIWWRACAENWLSFLFRFQSLLSYKTILKWNQCRDLRYVTTCTTLCTLNISVWWLCALDVIYDTFECDTLFFDRR